MSGPDWFRVTEIGDGAYALEEPGHVQSYLVIGAEKAALIDTGLGVADIRAAVARLTDLPVTALITHWHFDHIGGNALFGELGCAAKEAQRVALSYPTDFLAGLYIDSCLAEGPALPEGFDPTAYAITGKEPTFTVADGDTIDLGGRSLEAVATPGHTRGGLTFLDSASGSMFIGDCLYPGTLYAMFDDSDPAEFAASLARLEELRADYPRIFPGHEAFPLDGDLLPLARQAMNQVAQGREPDVIDSDWGADCHRHRFGAIEILAAPPGHPGIDLRPPGE